jgi:hypothetical protein
LWVVPLILVFLTFYLSKPSEEKCTQIAIERLETINIKASPNNIHVKDYVIMRVMKYVIRNDTLQLGSGFFFRVKVNDRKLEAIAKHGGES